MTNKAEIQKKFFEKNKNLTSHLIYKGSLISVKSLALKQKNKKSHKWDIVMHPGAVAVVPIDKENKIVMIKQFRQASNEIFFEIPAGILEENETKKKCAQRELQEEIGYKAKKIFSLGGIYTSPGFCNEYIYLFVAKNLEKSKLPPDEFEQIDVIHMSLEKVVQLINKNKIVDAKTICGILKYEKWIKKTKK